MKSEFLATMSHELRTPLNAVLGYNSLLRDGLFGDLNQQQEDALRRMRASAEHLLSLISDILDLSTVEAGKVQLRCVDIDMAEFLEALSETVRPMTAHKSLEYRLEVDPGMPTLRADVTRLRQVLLNLLSNAVKFTDSGSVTFRACAVDDGARIRFEVADTGIGVDPKDTELIFEEFRQVDQSATREYGGTGLGLAISRKLARLMGGSLELEQGPGRGATFTVELPVVPAPDQASAPASE
jgi:signal transduction histidine kinase